MLNWLTEHGPILEQLGVQESVRDVMCSMHCCSWFQLEKDMKLIVTNIGGRQGCKLESVLLNLIYSIALKRIRASLSDERVIIRLKPHAGCFWSSSGVDIGYDDSLGFTPIVEITYVDDQAFTLAATSPVALIHAYRCLLSA